MVDRIEIGEPEPFGEDFQDSLAWAMQCIMQATTLPESFFRGVDHSTKSSYAKEMMMRRGPQ